MASEKILVVDDDVRIVKIIRHCLEKEGYSVCSAVDGEEALRMAELQQPDLVVLDLMLPKINGLDVCKTLVAEQGVPVIILSAKGDELDRITGLRLGVDDYMTKPFSPMELVLRVQAVLRRIRGREKRREKEVIEVGDLRIEFATRQTAIRSVPVNLTGKEFELLWLLSNHPHQVFTRMQLLKKIWHSDYQGDENTVTVHVRRLREKIEPNPAEPRYIKTVWGVGYKFEAN